MKHLIPLAIVIASLGCSKDKDKESPVVTITSPTLGQSFEGGDVIRVTGTVTDDQTVSEVNLRVTHAVTGAIILEMTDEPGTPNFNFNYLVGSAITGVHYRIQVIAKDKVRHDDRKIVEFICH